MIQISLILVIFFGFSICYSYGNTCDFKNQKIECENFQSFNELDFSNVNDSIKEIILKPSEKIILDGSLDLLSLNFTSEYIVNLENIQAFQIFSNPFANRYLIKGNLYINNSIFDFYKDNEKIDIKTCDYINRFEIFVSLFDVFDLVSLKENVSYPTETCPSEFKHVNIGDFELFNLKKTNRLNFMKIPINDSDSDLDCSINVLKIFDSEIDLDTSLIYPEIFRNIKLFFIELSTITSIQEDLFKNLKNLKYFALKIRNFRELINMGNHWMKYLNYGVKVNLSDTSDVYRNSNKQMLFEMNDLNLDYDYPESDFCLFQNYPHERLVFPIIQTKKNLNCSCTLMYLIKNKNLFANDSNIILTDSIATCFNSNEFDDLIKNCEFEKRLATCKSKEPGSYNFKSLAIAFIVISTILLITLTVLITLIIKTKRNDNNFSIGFKPNLN